MRALAHGHFVQYVYIYIYLSKRFLDIGVIARKYHLIATIESCQGAMKLRGRYISYYLGQIQSHWLFYSRVDSPSGDVGAMASTLDILWVYGNNVEGESKSSLYSVVSRKTACLANVGYQREVLSND